MKQITIFMIRCYQWVFSPFVGMHCRFNPSCSHYAIQAIDRFGAIKGCYLASRRLLRCHPWHEGGHDPVPERKP